MLHRALLPFGLLASVVAPLSCAAKRAALASPLSTPRAEPQKGLRCSYTYGGEVKRVSVPPTHDAYSVRAHDVQGRFDFKVVYVDAPADVAGVRVYTYSPGPDAPVLIHQAKYAASYQNHGRYGFTGKHFVYDPRGREFEYFCEWLAP